MAMTETGLDSGAQQMLDILAGAAEKGIPLLHQVSPEEARVMNLRGKELFGSDGPDMATEDFSLPGGDGDIPVRLYRPADGVLPVVIYYHGGGWVIGSIQSHDGLCRELAKRSGAVVVSVDYRLAPEAPFPAAVDDCYAALEWVAAHATELQVDAKRLAVAGDSAGGNLAAVVAILARERKGPSISAQGLLYPATNMHCDTDSHRDFRAHLLTPESIDWFQNHYLRSAADKDDWRASPLLAEDLTNLPPAFVLTAGFDPLRDEGHLYSEALRAAGVAVTYSCFDGQIHGFLTLDKLIPQAIDAIEATASALREMWR
ncbi:MAG: alpha/beta hydrolase [Chromatiales bacterium]|nr:alpha/beta hydrolase [Chromatiales bacterium]